MIFSGFVRNKLTDFYILIARPKIDEGHKSLQYGSNDPRIAESQQVRPGPMRGMDFDRG